MLLTPRGLYICIQYAGRFNVQFVQIIVNIHNFKKYLPYFYTYTYSLFKKIKIFARARRSSSAFYVTFKYILIVGGWSDHITTSKTTCISYFNFNNTIENF